MINLSFSLSVDDIDDIDYIDIDIDRYIYRCIDRYKYIDVGFFPWAILTNAVIISSLTFSLYII